MLNRNDYSKLAAAFAATREDIIAHGASPSMQIVGWRKALNRVMDALAEDTPRFDRAKFEIAAGGAR